MNRNPYDANPPTGVPTVDNDSRLATTPRSPMRRDLPAVLHAVAIVAFAVALVSHASAAIDVRESVWVTAGLLATSVAFFLKELR